MQDQHSDDEQDRIQRALNEAKKRELAEKYGATFGSTESKAPPEIESQWLNYVDEFERQFENARQITVREYLGNPVFRPLGEISPAELKSELGNLMDFLNLNAVAVDCLPDVGDADLYRFVTTELMGHEIEDIRIDGMMHHFIYEEFHPNDEYDAKLFAEEFLFDVFHRRVEYAVGNLAEDELRDSQGRLLTKEEMKKEIEAFIGRYIAFIASHVESKECVVEGDYATVRVHTTWEGLRAGTMESVSASGVSVLRMKRSPYGGFDVIQANVVGWNSTEGNIS